MHEHQYVSTDIWISRKGFFPGVRHGENFRSKTIVRDFANLIEERVGTDTTHGLLFCIAGVAGSGKSRLIHEITETLKQNDNLRVWQTTALEINESVAASYLKRPVTDLGNLEEALRNRELFLVVDGIDEVDSDRAVKIASELRSLSKIRGSMVALAVRLEYLLKDYSVCQMLEQNSEEADQFYCVMGGLSLNEALQFFGDDEDRRSQVTALWQKNVAYSWFRRPVVMDFLSHAPTERDIESVFGLFKSIEKNVEPPSCLNLLRDRAKNWVSIERIDNRSEEAVERKNVFGPWPHDTNEIPEEDANESVFLVALDDMLKLKHRTVLEYFAARAIAEEYKMDRKPFADFFFHWDSRPFVVHAMNERKHKYEVALKHAIGLEGNDKWNPPFGYYKTLITDPWNADPESAINLVSSIRSLIVEDRPSDGVIRFLSYVLYDFRILMRASSLPCSRVIRNEMPIVLWDCGNFSKLADEPDSLVDSMSRLCIMGLRACNVLGSAVEKQYKLYVALGRQALASSQQVDKQLVSDLEQLLPSKIS